MIDPYRAFRQLERKIFRGVPEQPEPTWERDPNAHVPERLTGRSQRAEFTAASDLGGRVIATFIYRPDDQVVEVEAPARSPGTGKS